MVTALAPSLHRRSGQLPHHHGVSRVLLLYRAHAVPRDEHVIEGTTNSVNMVPTTIPLTSMMPMPFRAPAPGPVAITSGKCPTTVAAVVMRIGRKRVPAASITASSFALPGSWWFAAWQMWMLPCTRCPKLVNHRRNSGHQGHPPGWLGCTRGRGVVVHGKARVR